MFRAERQARKWAQQLCVEQDRLDALRFKNTLTESPDYLAQKRVVERIQNRLVAMRSARDTFTELVA